MVSLEGSAPALPKNLFGLNTTLRTQHIIWAHREVRLPKILKRLQNEWDRGQGTRDKEKLGGRGSCRAKTTVTGD